MATLLILGRSGQLARALADAAPARFDTVICAGRAEADLARRGAVTRLINAVGPDAVINAAAWTAVDAAQTDEARAVAINAHGAGEAALAARAASARFVHVSTDYVFGGDARVGPFDEAAAPAPVNAYGRSKLAGEIAVAGADPCAAIVRTSGVFSGRGADFPSAMWRLACKHDQLRVVADQLTTPTPADALAERLVALALRPDAAGLFHAAGAPGVSWADVAEAAMKVARAAGGRAVPVEPITTDQFPRPAPRPSDSRLGGDRLGSAIALGEIDWAAGLGRAYALWSAAR